MSRYAVKFSKLGYIKYTSHLDLLRLFKRAIKRSDIRLNYSQGFNPHPKLGFAQPLSLGYEALNEILEIETKERYLPSDLKNRLEKQLPEGIKINDIIELPSQGKSLAANVYEAEYILRFPVIENVSVDGFKECLEKYNCLENITALKKQKKTKELKEVDIKDMIKEFTLIPSDNEYLLYLRCDCGSDSNLSPELVISSFIKFSGYDLDRACIEVMRKSLKIKEFKF